MLHYWANKYNDDDDDDDDDDETEHVLNQASAVSVCRGACILQKRLNRS